MGVQNFIVDRQDVNKQFDEFCDKRNCKSCEYAYVKVLTDGQCKSNWIMDRFDLISKDDFKDVRRVFGMKRK